MIKSTELRIGNWVNYKTEPFKIKGVVLKNIIDDDKDDCVYEDEYAGYSIDDITPIPLTPEILEKAGFEKEPEGYYIKDGCPVIAFENSDIFGNANKCEYSIEISKHCQLVLCIDGDFYTFNGDSGYGSYTYSKCKYIHQLQNLYFSLTGTELEINL